MNNFFVLQQCIKYTELMAALTGILFWKKFNTGYFRWFIIYLLIIACCEFSAYFLKQYAIGSYKYLFAYFVIPLEFLFFHWLYFKYREKRIAIFSAVFYITAFVFENIFLKGSKFYFFSISYSIGSITLLILSTRYFLRLIDSNEIISFYKQIFFWVNAGILVFYIGTFPYYGLFHYLVATDYNLFMKLSWVQVILNILMYIFFSISFICSKTKS